MYFGCHLSSSNGYLNMGKVAQSICADTFAFFTRNPRGGAAKALDMDDVNALNNFLKENKFGTLVAHAPYTMNPCSDKEDTRNFARQVFAEDLKRMECTPNQFYNFHPGSHMKQGVEKAVEMICEMINENVTSNLSTTILLETMAGKGTEVGSKFEELKSIIDNVECKEKIGVCFDTCHVYDAGYDIVNNLDGVLEEFDKVIGLERLKAVHINDSMNPFCSHKDRHECIGKGSIGVEAFARIVNHEVFRDKPFILETPNELDGYRNEIELLRGLVK